MESDPMEGPCRIRQEERLNVFALVIYIPGLLGTFLDDLRRELVPDYNPNAHVSVLPPRPLSAGWQVASEHARAVAECQAPFEIELTAIEAFPVTDVIYIEVGAGGAELRKMHAAMNAGTLQFQDAFPYHPHITLAQELPAGSLAATKELAERRWREFGGERRLVADRAVFVQNTVSGRWIDLAEYSFAGKRESSEIYSSETH